MNALLNVLLIDMSEDAAKRLAQATGPSQLLELVTMLGDRLTKDDSRMRSQATQALSATISHVEGLSQQQMGVLVEFLSDKLDDEPCIEPAINGLRAIAQKPGFNFANLRSALAKVRKLSFPQLPSSTRRGILLLFNELVLAGWSQSVSAFLRTVSGEKDPHNLHLLLEVVRKILSLYTLSGSELEDIFDLCFCYFPLTFKSPGDKSHPNLEPELHLALRRTLSRPELAPWSIPALVSKVYALSIPTKIDALETLSELLVNLDTEQLVTYFEQIWAGVEYEFLHGSFNEDLQESACSTLSTLLPVERLMDDKMRKLFSLLNDEALGPRLCKLIASVYGNASPDRFAAVTDPALDLILKETDAGDHTKICLINCLLASAHPLSHQDEIFSLLLSFLVSTNHHRSEAVEGLRMLVHHSPEFASMVVQTLTSSLGEEELRGSAVRVLADMALTYPDDIQNFCVLKLLSKLEDSWGSESQYILESLSVICRTGQLFHALAIQLTSCLLEMQDRAHVLQIVRTLNSSAEATETTLKPKCDSNKVIADNFGHHGDFTASDFAADEVVLPLIEVFLQSPENTAYTSDIVIEITCRLCETTSRSIIPARHARYGDKVMQLFQKYDVVERGKPTIMFCLFTSLVVNLGNLPSFTLSFIDLLKVLGQSNRVLERSGYLRLLALAANKWTDLFGDLNLYLNFLNNAARTGPDSMSALEAWAWTTKGLVMRADSTGFAEAEKIVALAADPILGAYFARVFGVLIAPDICLSKSNGCQIRQLYRQRLSEQTFKQIYTFFEQNVSTLNCLSILGTLLRYGPEESITSASALVFPMLIKCLDVELDDVRLAAIKYLSKATPRIGELVSANIDTIISKLLLLTRDPIPDVRAGAVAAIANLRSHLPAHHLRPYRDTIISALAPVLGDYRREVRREAARCRQLYFSMLD